MVIQPESFAVTIFGKRETNINVTKTCVEINETPSDTWLFPARKPPKAVSVKKKRLKKCAIGKFRKRVLRAGIEFRKTTDHLAWPDLPCPRMATETWGQTATGNNDDAKMLREAQDPTLPTHHTQR